MRHHGALLCHIASWMHPDGLLFVHIFAHREFAFEVRGESDWMSRHFFIGGIMPRYGEGEESKWLARWRILIYGLRGAVGLLERRSGWFPTSC